MRELAAIHADRDQVREAIANAGQGTDVSQWQVEEMRYTDELAEATAHWGAVQAHESRLQEATTESSSFLGDIDIAGVPIAESGLSELAFSILNSKVQAKHIAAIEKLSLAMNEQQTRFQQDLKEAIERATNSEYTAEQLNVLNNEQEVKIYQLELENTELDIKARKGAELLFEATETIAKQNELIEGYKKAELLAPQPTVTLSTSEQVAQQEAQLKASRIKVTRMELSNPDDFNTRDWFVVLALTGELVAINYLQKGLYTLISESEAEQLRADEANKKAELELQNTIIPVQELQIDPVNPVLEEEAPAEENSFQIPTADSQGNSSLERNESLDESVGPNEESEVVTRAEFADLKKRVWDLENGFVQQAVA